MPFSEAVDSRVLLTRLRETLAEPGGGQERLDRIVQLVAAGLVAEVCSIYLRRDGPVAGALRDRGAETRGGASDAAAGRPGPGRAHRRDRRADQHPRRPRHPRLSLSCPRPARRCLRASSACRSSAWARCWACWWCRTSERAGIHRGRGLRARGRRDGAGRDGRARRLHRTGADGDRRGSTGCPFYVQAGSSARRAWPRGACCCTSRRSW